MVACSRTNRPASLGVAAAESVGVPASIFDLVSSAESIGDRRLSTLGANMAKKRNNLQRNRSDRNRPADSTVGIHLFQDNLSWKWTIALMVLAYVLVVSIRFGWLAYAQNMPAYWWQGEPIYNNNDSVYFACTLQKALDGAHASNQQVPDLLDNGMITTLPYLLIRVLPISIESVILLMGPLVSGLLVVPLILIGRLYGSVTWGFLAALLGGGAHSYFNRTHVGYFDTDMYAVTVPTLAFFFLLMAIRRDSLMATFLGSLTLFLYPFFYRPGLPIAYGLGGAFLLYQFGIWLVDRQLSNRNNDKPFPWDSVLLVSLGLSLAPLSRGPLVRDYFPFWVLAFAGILAATILLKKRLLRGHVLTATSLASVAALTIVAIVVAWPLIQKVANRALVSAPTPQSSAEAAAPATTTNGQPQHLHFKDILSAVRETAKIPWPTVAARISGSTFGAVVAILGYALLCLVRREFLIALPFAAIGIVSYWLGLRFTIYAVPIAALSATFLVMVVARLISSNPRVVLPLAAVGAACLIYPNIEHAWGYHVAVQTVLGEPGVRALDTLGQQADENDFVITWWDYGSAVWMYAGCRTINSPASNSSPDNYLLSKILTTDSQQQAANLSREAVENYIAKGNDERVAGKPPYRSAIQRILRDGTPEMVDPNQYLRQTATADFDGASKTRDVFLFMPYEMLPILRTVYSFSNRDLSTGSEGSPRQFMPVVRNVTQRGNVLTLGPLRIDLGRKTAIDIRNRRNVPLSTLQIVQHKGDERPKIEKLFHFDPKGNIHVVILNTDGKWLPLVMDTRMFNSAAVQMYIFEKYDKDLFELVTRTSKAKIYRVKQ